MNTIKLCINCAYHHIPAGIRMSDNIVYCTFRSRRNLVNGQPLKTDMADCYAMRSQVGLCGPEGRLFSTELSASDFDRVFNPTDLPLEGHSLDKSSQENGVSSGVSISENSVNLSNGNVHVLGNDIAGQGGGFTG